MQRKFTYPIDTAVFEGIRESGKVYVDKTEMLYDLVSHYKYIFLARPRRFGKSLMCYTLKSYFQGKKHLFEGLKMAEYEKNWYEYPVFHFIMSGLKNCTIAEARSKLGAFLADYENIYGCRENETTPGTRFRGLIHRAYEQTGRKAVIILDEYDSPILRLLSEPEKKNEMRELLREFYQVLKDEDEHLQFVFITGVTKFSQLSIFSELNNLRQISMLDEYSGICGITQEELDTALRPCVEDFAQKLGMGVEEAYAALKKFYDGYHFSPNSKDVYAPFSLLRALDDARLSEYWFDSGTSSSLLEYLKNFPVKDAVNCDGQRVRLNEFNIPCEDATTALPLLYQSGYLSIRDYDRRRNTYTLQYPNQEVRSGMVNCLMPIIMKRTVRDNNSLSMEMTDAMFDGNLSQMLLAMRSYIAGIPYDVITKEEWEDKAGYEAFYQMLLYFVFTMLNDTVECEHKSIRGRSDVVIKTDTDIFVLELKVDGNVQEALEQIEAKDYAVQWTSDGRQVTKAGVNISSERRNITQWRITDAEGNIIEDKDFEQ